VSVKYRWPFSRLANIVSGGNSGITGVTARRLVTTALSSRGRLQPYTRSLLIVVGATALAFAMNFALDVERPSRIFLVAVVLSAVTLGLWPALFASLISALAYDFFFLPPPYTLYISTYEGVVDFLLFVISAIVVTTLTARVQRYAVLADARALTAEKLSSFSARLNEATTSQGVLDVAAEQVSALLRAPVMLVNEMIEPMASASFPPFSAPGPGTIQDAIASWANWPTDDGNSRREFGDWEFHPLRGTEGRLGLLATRTAGKQFFHTAQQQHLLLALSNQIAMALERRTLQDRLEEERLQAEAGKLRAAVLTSISHDLRGPLSTVLGSARMLEDRWNKMGDGSKLRMVHIVREETERLDAFLGKLLDMTKIEAGAMQLHCGPVEVCEAIEAAVAHIKPATTRSQISIQLDGNLPPVQADAMLLEQALCNVLENAIKYSPSGSHIDIRVRADANAVYITIQDEGEGIPEYDQERIFEKFFRSERMASQTKGSGLGLAICRGFLASMNGSISASNRADRTGAAFTLTLPIAICQAICEVEP
jgi:two-component system, OmpR family, sensor histidine kinase KdpD